MGRKSRESAERRQAKRRAEAAEAAAAARPPVPAKKRRATAEKPENVALKGIRSTNRPRAPQHVRQPAPLKLVLGERAKSDRKAEALTWTCPDCQRRNLPRRGLIADIPVLRCECGRESEIEFDFSLANVKINDQSPITKENVKMQNEKDCLLCATTSNMEITLQMRSILAGETFQGKETTINMVELNKRYEHMQKRPDVEKDENNDEDTILVLAAIAKHIGVITDEKTQPKIHKLPEYVKVKSTFYDIVRVLADGHPLTTGVITGKNFENLKPGQIYKAPREERLIRGEKSRIGHAILLVGAGRKGNTNYYHFMNSWGNYFCLEEDGKRYGFGMIRASDIRIQPVKFIRYKEEVELHKRLASTDL